MCCSSSCSSAFLCTHYGQLQFFSTYFRKLKEIGVLRSIFSDYVISCDYGMIYREEKNKQNMVKIFFKALAKVFLSASKSC